MSTSTDSALHAALTDHLTAPAAAKSAATLDGRITALIDLVRVAGYAPRSETIDRAAQVVREDVSPFHDWRSQEALAESIEALR